jgi:Carbohydrate binding domain (family 11)
MKSACHPFMAVAAMATLGACSTGAPGSSSAPPPVFGGQGAVVRQTPAEMPLPAEAASAPKPQGPCVGPSRDSDVALLDDFEDGDSHLFQAFQRDGYWWSGTDATEGATIYPEVSKFMPDRLPPAEATRGNLYAAHLKAAGQRDWGVTWGVGLQWVSKGIRCPLNVSAFGGLRFRAKGPGTVRVAFSMPETQAKEHGGECTTGCYDFHGKLVFLDDRWSDYVVPFDHLQQGGWGAQARFDPAHILGISFAVKSKDLPIEFWVDDLSLVTAAEATALAAAERAQPVPTKSAPAAPATHAGKPASPAL